MKIIVAISIVLILLIGGFFAFNHYIYNEKQASEPHVEENFPGESSSGEEVVQLYFPDDPNLLEPFTQPTTRRVVAGTQVEIAEQTLQHLFQGPTRYEVENNGYFSVFDTKDISLLETYQKIEIEDSTAYLYFDSRSLAYLNAPAAEQGTIKIAIRKTLEQFGVGEVEYVIDGEIFTEWDA